MESSHEDPHAHASSYWASYLAKSEPCLFPRLRTSVDGPKRSMSLRVNLESLQELRQFSGSEEAALPSLLHVAWGLLLRCYTGLDDVCFGYRETGSGTAGNERPRMSAPLKGMPVARLTVNDMSSVADTLGKAKGEYISGLPYQSSAPFDTTNESWSSTRQLFDTVVELRSFSNPPAFNNIGVSLPSLNVVFSEEVCIGSSLRHLGCLLAYADTSHSPKYAFWSSMEMATLLLSWSGGAATCPWSKLKTLPAHWIRSSLSSSFIHIPSFGSWTCSVIAISNRYQNGTAHPR